jgi:hypothetical protein
VINRRFLTLAVCAFMVLSARGAFAVTTGPAVAGTLLSDPSSSFDVLVTGASGESFGSITLIDNALSLTPTNFQLPFTFGPSNGVLPGSIDIRLTPKSGDTALTALALQELGDYWLDGSVGSTLGVRYNLSAGNVGGGQSAVQQDSGALAATGMFNFAPWLLTGSLATGTTAGTWQSAPGGAVEFVLTNTIYWTLASNDSAFLEKKDAGVALQVTTTTVPLPGTAWLLAPAALWLLRRRPGR